MERLNIQPPLPSLQLPQSVRVRAAEWMRGGVPKFLARIVFLPVSPP